MQPKLDDAGAVRLDEDFGNVFDDVLDDLHRNPSQQHAGLAPMSTHEREKLEHQNRQFCRALRAEVNDRIRSQGIIVEQVELMEEGYVARLTDGRGRFFEATITLDEALGTAAGENMGRAIIGMVCERALAARNRYYERAQLIEVA